MRTNAFRMISFAFVSGTISEIAALLLRPMRTGHSLR
jgi:hypothetical protein